MSNHSTSWEGSGKTCFVAGLLMLLITGCSSSLHQDQDSSITNIGGINQSRSGADELSKHLGAAQPLNVSPRAASLFRQASQAFKEGRYDLAEKSLESLIDLEPDLSSPLTNLGIVYTNTSREGQAMNSFNSALELDPDDCASLVEIGILERQQRLYIQAEERYLACIISDKSYAVAYLNLGILYEIYMGRLPEALSNYQTYQTLSPSKMVATWVMDLTRRVEVEKRLVDGGQRR